MLVNRFVVSVYFSVTSVLALFYVCINDIKLFLFIYIYTFFVNLEFTVNKDTYTEKFIFN